MALADVRKELNFCKKADIAIIGVVENMSGFVCPGCSKESEIFPPVTGGAEKMCADFQIPLLSKIPLEPQLLMSCEKGACFATSMPDSVTAKRIRLVEEGVLNYRRPTAPEENEVLE